jgi:hypothetical protein
MALDRVVVEQALAALKPAFEADGARLEVGTLEKGRVTINVFVNGDTCRECLLPVPQLEILFRQVLLELDDRCEVRVTLIES